MSWGVKQIDGVMGHICTWCMAWRQLQPACYLKQFHPSWLTDPEARKIGNRMLVIQHYWNNTLTPINTVPISFPKSLCVVLRGEETQLLHGHCWRLVGPYTHLFFLLYRFIWGDVRLPTTQVRQSVGFFEDFKPWGSDPRTLWLYVIDDKDNILTRVFQIGQNVAMTLASCSL